MYALVWYPIHKNVRNIIHVHNLATNLTNGINHSLVSLHNLFAEGDKTMSFSMRSKRSKNCIRLSPLPASLPMVGTLIIAMYLTMGS